MAQMKVDLIDKMGSDLSVVNAARVSFDKTSSYIEDHMNQTWVLDEADQRLLKYLSKHGHWSPFSHAFASFRIKAPLFVARQLAKHQVGLAWNEVSRRYVDDEPEFYEPDIWRESAASVKQGSSDKPVWYSDELRKDSEAWHRSAGKYYNNMIDNGVCPEQARMVLPQSMMTEWIWSGSLYAFSRVCKLRLDSHTQKETREVAEAIDTYMNRSFPHSWEALNG